VTETEAEDFRLAIIRLLSAFDEELELLTKKHLGIKSVIRCKYEPCNRITLTTTQWRDIKGFRRDVPGLAKYAAKGLCNTCYVALGRREGTFRKFLRRAARDV
jgi:hypothetical protein